MDAWSVVGYSTAEAIDLLGLQEELSIMKEEQQEKFTQVPSVAISCSFLCVNINALIHRLGL